MMEILYLYSVKIDGGGVRYCPVKIVNSLQKKIRQKSGCKDRGGGGQQSYLYTAVMEKSIQVQN